MQIPKKEKNLSCVASLNIFKFDLLSPHVRRPSVTLLRHGSYLPFNLDDLLSFSPEHRYLQTLHSISAEKNSTIIFPLPIDTAISGLMGGSSSIYSNAALGASSIAPVHVPPATRLERLAEEGTASVPVDVGTDAVPMTTPNANDGSLVAVDVV